jgi:hypothetical protein
LKVSSGLIQISAREEIEPVFAFVIGISAFLCPSLGQLDPS